MIRNKRRVEARLTLKKIGQFQLPILSQANDSLMNRPFAEENVLLLHGACFVPLEMPSDMLHTLVPAAWAREEHGAEPALTLCWWSTLLVPASSPHLFQASLEIIALLLRCWLARAAAQPWGVHAALVLCEEVLAVEVVGMSSFGAPLVRSCGCRTWGSLVADVARAHIASVES